MACSLDSPFDEVYHSPGHRVFPLVLELIQDVVRHQLLQQQLPALHTPQVEANRGLPEEFLGRKEERKEGRRAEPAASGQRRNEQSSGRPSTLSFHFVSSLLFSSLSFPHSPAYLCHDLVLIALCQQRGRIAPVIGVSVQEKPLKDVHKVDAVDRFLTELRVQRQARVGRQRKRLQRAIVARKERAQQGKAQRSKLCREERAGQGRAKHRQTDRQTHTHTGFAIVFPSTSPRSFLTLVALHPLPPALALADHSNHQRHIRQGLAERWRSIGRHRKSAHV